jgi:signal transduction histidine kinase
LILSRAMLRRLACAMETKGAVSNYLGRVRETLRLGGPQANDTTARVLHALLLALVCWRILWFPVILPFARKKPEAAAIFGAMLLVLLVALWLLRRGSLMAASWVFLCGNWVLNTFLITLSKGIRSHALVFYLVLPISAAWLLGFRAALLTAGVCAVSSLTFALLQQIGIQLPGTFASAAPVAYWSEVLVAMIITTVPVSRILQLLQEALARSRTAELTLQEYQEGLEELIRQRTRELEEARDQAQAASRAKSAFLATVSHELRSPLNTILLLSDPGYIHAGTSDACRQDLDVIQRSGKHLLHVINDVLDSARVEAGHVIVEAATVDLCELVREVRDLMQVRAEKKSLDLCVEEMPGCPRFIHADESKLRHILINLLDNAIKYTERGKVTLREAAGPADSANGLRLRFEVVDTGVGIAPQDQARVFEPFVRAGNVAAREGTGLGLSITRQYVDAMGGSIRLESVPGEGSHFFVELPVDLGTECEAVPAKGKQSGLARVALG